MTKAAKLCQFNPNVPQWSGVQRVFDITSPEYHFHDDTVELAKLLAFLYQFKDGDNPVFIRFRLGILNFITSHGFIFILPLFHISFFIPTLNYWVAQTTKEEKSHFSFEQSLISLRRSPSPRVAISLSYH